ncbi:hypothetical protein EV356DRAFT_68611 [Viridothelium virens]|uniref:Uncharacterized protein n=1 Tax=Viridothelium virens TaxID=1048519 RepID=A0A6A6HE83_VIRVR|nr:hypothetical protein EV356DRAFT_68611 [Viridothelium virens]
MKDSSRALKPLPTIPSAFGVHETVQLLRQRASAGICILVPPRVGERVSYSVSLLRLPLSLATQKSSTSAGAETSLLLLASNVSSLLGLWSWSQRQLPFHKVTIETCVSLLCVLLPELITWNPSSSWARSIRLGDMISAFSFKFMPPDCVILA